MKQKDIVFIYGNRTTKLNDGDRLNLHFDVDFEIGIVPGINERKIITKDVVIKGRTKKLK